MPVMTFDLSEVLSSNSAWRAVTGVPVAQLHADDTCLAAYREGRTLLGTDDLRAAAAFRLVRERLAHCPSKDHGLGAASIGWDARAELNLEHLIRAVELYADHYATGDCTASMSLQIACRKLFEADAETLLAAARHPLVRRVATLYLAARGGPFRPAPPIRSSQAWLNAVEQAGAENLDCADLLGWSAYQAGDYASAKRWTERAPRQSAATGWVRDWSRWGVIQMPENICRWP